MTPKILKMRYQYYWVLLIVFLSIGCEQKPQKIEEIAIIPKPLEQTLTKGSFVFQKEISLVSNSEFISTSEYLTLFLEKEVGISLHEESQQKIFLNINEKISHEEGYELHITPNQILIDAKTEKGAFYGVQTLLQLFPIEINREKPIALPCLKIKDQPQFLYRGMHLDVARHMYSVNFIKKYIDLMSQLKMNTFHWHLTEDQGWRIEIKKYPKLQEIAAYRKETLIGHYSDQPHQFDGKRYGGYYTQEQIKDIVAYAQQRQITVIPEIEMPGHSQAAIAAYPELGCALTGLRQAQSDNSATQKPIEVATKWGVFEEVYCPSEKTFQFLEDVIDEVVQLFPGKYIHIGGDEAPKTRWKNCSYCQTLIRKKGLKDEHGLQSYFIQRMEKYINSKGKQIIGWDEILEGGLAPNATVMSWRGTKGAVDAAKEGHDVILTPTSHCYFDYYQSDNENEPLAIGGFLPLEKVYAFNPIPEELNEEESKYVLGAQGNVWTEYMPDEKKVEYMAFPRAIALSEVLWSSPEKRDYKNFITRLERFQKRLDQQNVNYANHIYEVTGELKNTDGKLTYELNTTSNTYPIYFSTDGGYPNREYLTPIDVDSSMTIKAFVKNNEQVLGNAFEQMINVHKGVGAKITIDKEPHPSYNAGGKQALINGISGNNKRYGDKEWLGFWGQDVEIEIEFEKPVDIKFISMRFHNGNGQWIYAPTHIAARITLEDDGIVANKFIVNDENTSTVISSEMTFNTLSQMIAKKVVLIIPNYGVIPEGKQGAGNRAWTFIDEIVIE